MTASVLVLVLSVIFLAVTAAESETSRREQLIKEKNAFCDDRDDGDYQNPTDPCGKLFYVCSHHNTFILYCPENLALNPITDRCEYLSDVPGCGYTSRRTTTTSRKTTRTPSRMTMRTTTLRKTTTKTTPRRMTTTTRGGCYFDHPCTSTACCPANSVCLYFPYFSSSTCQQLCSSDQQCQRGPSADYCRMIGYSGSKCCTSTFDCPDYPGTNFCMCK